ncbi:MAG: hypothetical protein LEGION0398_MBIBDBAK_01270 [Legionellaceae bacterium]
MLTRMNSRYTIIICLIFCLLLLNSIAYATEKSVAIVINTKGSVAASDNKNKERILKRGSPLYSGDTISTNQEGEAQIRFSDGALIVIKHASTFKIDHYSYKQMGKTNSSHISLLKGQFRNVSGALAKENPKSAIYKTPTATIGLRGTDHEESITVDEELFRVVSGSIEVELGDDESRILEADEVLGIDLDNLEFEEIDNDDPRLEELSISIPTEEDIEQVLEENEIIDNDSTQTTTDEAQVTEEQDTQTANDNNETDSSDSTEDNTEINKDSMIDEE